MLEIARYLYHKEYTKKQKPQINNWFLNILHILGQDFFYCEQGYYSLPNIPTTSGVPEMEAQNWRHILGQENPFNSKPGYYRLLFLVVTIDSRLGNSS